MHSEVQRDVPGKCPGCGMDLIPKKQEPAGTKNDHVGHDMRKASHVDHEAAMTNPAIAKQMEAEMRRRFFVSFLLKCGVLKTKLNSLFSFM